MPCSSGNLIGLCLIVQLIICRMCNGGEIAQNLKGLRLFILVTSQLPGEKHTYYPQDAL